MTILLNGKEVASSVTEELKGWVNELNQSGVKPTLALVLVGEDEYSRRYVKMKERRAKKVGLDTRFHHLQNSKREELINLINSLNADPQVHGIMVQLPLPDRFNELSVVQAISPKKDVDALSPSTLGKLLMGEEEFLPAGVEAIMELLLRYDIDPEHKHWVIIGLSNIVGKPLATKLMNMEAEVTCFKELNSDAVNFSKGADVLVVDIQSKWAVTADMVKKGAIIIDNGNNYEGRKVYGDVNFEDVKPVASAITPVPGGVGPLLIAMLFRSTLKSAAGSIV